MSGWIGEGGMTVVRHQLTFYSSSHFVSSSSMVAVALWVCLAQDLSKKLRELQVARRVEGGVSCE